jgi:cytochrome oxidase Cu insertion factor (SCO1/SenC/PrrC family)
MDDMRLGSARATALLGCVLALLWACVRPVAAHEFSAQALVLQVDRVHGSAIVRAAQGPASPNVIHRVRFVPASFASRVRVGQTLAGTLDEDTTPWTFSSVILVGTQTVVGAPSAPPASSVVLRDVTKASPGDRLPDGNFIDQTGAPFALRSLEGRPIVLGFVYTRCADTRVCPLISARFAQLQSRLRGTSTALVEITLDPAFDRPAVLARYGHVFGADPARWKLLTGDPDAVLSYAARFGVSAIPDKRIGLIHDVRTVLIDPNGEIRQLIDENSWSADELIAQLRADQHLASNPLARLNLWLSSAAVALCGNSVAGFSGLTDLLVVLAIFGGFGWLLFRLARGIYRSA